MIFTFQQNEILLASRPGATLGFLKIVVKSLSRMCMRSCQGKPKTVSGILSWNKKGLSTVQTRIDDLLHAQTPAIRSELLVIFEASYLFSMRGMLKKWSVDPFPTALSIASIDRLIPILPQKKLLQV